METTQVRLVLGDHEHLQCVEALNHVAYLGDEDHCFLSDLLQPLGGSASPVPLFLTIRQLDALLAAVRVYRYATYHNVTEGESLHALMNRMEELYNALQWAIVRQNRPSTDTQTQVPMTTVSVVPIVDVEKRFDAPFITTGNLDTHLGETTPAADVTTAYVIPEGSHDQDPAPTIVPAADTDVAVAPEVPHVKEKARKHR